MSEELDKWRQQRLDNEAAQRLQRPDTTHRARSVRLPAPPDLTFSRTPLQNSAYGTQNTVVISDGRPPDEINRYQQQQEEMRLRAEESTRRQAEKRRYDQEAARRQREAGDAAQMARLSISDPSSSLAASSVYYPPPAIEYPNLQASTRTTANPNPPDRQPGYYDSRGGPALLPLENPSRYEGDSTDSESVHKLDTRRLVHHRPPDSRSPLRHLRPYAFRLKLFIGN